MNSSPGSERVSRRLREQFAPAYLAIAGVVVVIASSVPMWNEILRFAQGGLAGGDRSGPAPGTEPS